MTYFSFTDWDGISPERNFTGTDNYQQLITRPELFRVFLVSLYYLAASAGSAPPSRPTHRSPSSRSRTS